MLAARRAIMPLALVPLVCCAGCAELTGSPSATARLSDPTNAADYKALGEGLAHFIARDNPPAHTVVVLYDQPISGGIADGLRSHGFGVTAVSGSDPGILMSVSVLRIAEGYLVQFSIGSNHYQRFFRKTPGEPVRGEGPVLIREIAGVGR